jgi:K+-transporting ATPase KdpF subunit
LETAVVLPPWRSEFDDGPALRRRGDSVLRAFLESDSSGRERLVNLLYIIGGLLAAGLLVYLFVALLKPEIFS